MEKSLNYQYNYARINTTTGKCVGVRTMTYQVDSPEMIEIPVYDPDYYGKYYLNGSWYEDAEGTTPWESSLL